MNLKQDDSLFCRIYIDDIGKWIDGVLLYIDLEKSVADIFMSTRHFKSMLSEGSRVTIKSLDSNEEYTFSGTVSKKIVSIRRQAITINIDNVLKFENKRIFERFQAHYPAILKKTNTNITASGILLDISSGGIFLASPYSYEPNSTLDVEIYFATERPINFVGRILRKSPNSIGFNYGIIIEEIDNSNAVILNKLIEYLVTEKHSILDELKLFKRMNVSIYIIIFLFVVFILALFFKN